MGANPSFAPRVLCFGVFVLDLETGELRKSGLRVRLSPRAHKVLALLATRAGRLVTRQEIQHELWGEATFVDFEQGVNHCVKQIRDALGDDAEAPRFVETLPRRGYRFIVPTETMSPPESPVPPEDSAAVVVDVRPTRPATSDWRRRIVTGIGLIAVAVATTGNYTDPETTEPGRPSRTRLAVLPFANLSGDPDQEHVADNLTEDVISELGSLEPARLGVIARTSSMTYKGARKSVAEIGRELEVDYVLEGSVRRNGLRLRVSARLVGVSDEAQVWADQFEGELCGPVSLPRVVALRLARGLQLEAEPLPSASPHSRSGGSRVPPTPLRSARPGGAPSGASPGVGASEAGPAAPDEADLAAAPPTTDVGPP
jgi:TolB-like protein/DNA-binding winged helix-turn-helix (wHTH) protein